MKITIRNLEHHQLKNQRDNVTKNDINANGDSIFDNRIKPLPPFMSINEACDTFKVSRATINRLREKGLINGLKMGDSKKSKVILKTEEMLDLLERSIL